MKWKIISDKELPSSLTPRELLHQNFGGKLQFKCQHCDMDCGEIVLHDTPEKLYNDLRNYICHDPSLPLMFDPEEPDADIPTDAALCCVMAHQFEAERHLSDEVLSKIEKSLQAGAIHRVLYNKMVAAKAKHGDPLKRLYPDWCALEATGPCHCSSGTVA